MVQLAALAGCAGGIGDIQILSYSFVDKNAQAELGAIVSVESNAKPSSKISLSEYLASQLKKNPKRTQLNTADFIEFQNLFYSAQNTRLPEEEYILKVIFVSDVNLSMYSIDSNRPIYATYYSCEHSKEIVKEGRFSEKVFHKGLILGPQFNIEISPRDAGMFEYYTFIEPEGYFNGKRYQLFGDKQGVCLRLDAITFGYTSTSNVEYISTSDIDKNILLQASVR